MKYKKLLILLAQLIIVSTSYAQNSAIEDETHENDVEEIDIDLFIEEEFGYKSNADLIDKNLQKAFKDSLLTIKTKLTGLWTLKGKYKNSQFLTDTLSYISYSKSNNSKIEILTDSGIVYVNKVNDVVIDINKKENLKVIEFKFNPNSVVGSFQNYDNYDPNSNMQLIESCQPIPEVVRYKNSYYILYVGMGGDSLEKIKFLDQSKLIFVENENIEVVYEKLLD